MPNMAQLRPRLSPGYFESFAVFFLENESCRFTWKYNQTKLIQRQSLCLFEICYIFAFSMKEPADGRGVVTGLNFICKIELILKTDLKRNRV